ncbi:IMPACT family protein [Sulfuricurvum kujiense]
MAILYNGTIKKGFMVTVNAISSDTIEIKGSKFIAFLMPMAMYEEQMASLRSHHPKAVHFVSATRSLNEFDQIVEYSGDDGEPKGTSGKPTLSVLQGHELINAAIITVRYFGGTKLGPGGLVRAYAEVANAAYSQAELLPYEKLFEKRIQCDYSHITFVEYECIQNNVQILNKDFGVHGAIFEIQGTQDRLDRLLNVLGRCVV